jgi:hypothetical protein
MALLCLLMSRDYFAVTAFVDQQHQQRGSSRRGSRQRQHHHKERSTAKPPHSPWSSPSAPRQSFSAQNHFKSVLLASSSSSLLDASSGEKILSGASVEHQQLVADMAERPHLVTREACHTFFRTVLTKPSSSPWCANDDVAMVNQLFRDMQQLPQLDGRPTRETYELVQQVWLMASPSASTQNPDTWLNHLQSLWGVYQTNIVDHSDDDGDTDESFLSQQEALWAPRRSTYLYTLKGLLQCVSGDQKGTSSFSRWLDDTEALFDQMVHHAKTLPAVAPDILCANQVL